MPSALDLERIDVLLQERAQLRDERLSLLDLRGVELGLRMDQVKLEIAEEELLAEAGERPFSLPRRFSDVASFLLRYLG
jgi:hypothetical protein